MKIARSRVSPIIGRVFGSWESLRHRLASRPDLYLSLALAFGSLALYLRTLAPGILEGDYGEFQYTANILGIPHATGYPLYILVSKVFTLFPVGNPAWRVTLVSATCAALSVPVDYLLGYRVSGSRLAALVAAALFAFTPSLWGSAVVAKVYTLNTLLIALTLFWALRWYDQPNSRDLYFAAFTFGLALDNHRLAFFVAPALVLILWWRREQLDLRRWAIAGLLVVLPLLLYLYIPVRASQLLAEQSPANWALYPRPEAILKGTVSAYYNPTPYGILSFVTGFGNLDKLGFQDTVGPDSASGRLSNDFFLLLQQFGPVGLVLALFGVVVLFRREVRLTLILLSAALGIALISILLHARSTEFYFSGMYIVAALFIAASLTVLIRHLQARRWLHKAVLFSLGLFLAVTLWTNFARLDKSGDTAYDAYARQLLEDHLSAKSVIIAPWEIATPLRYLQFVEGQRPDLVIINESPIRPQFAKILESAHTLGRPFYYVQFNPEDQNAPGPRTVQATALPLPSAPEPQHSVNAPLNDTVRVLGYDLSPDPAQPGKTSRLSIYYQVIAATRSEFKEELELTNIRGEPVGNWEGAPVSVYYPTYRWRAGEYYRDVWDIPWPANAPRGLYSAQLSWYRQDAATNALDLEHPDTLNLGFLREGDWHAGAIAHRQTAEFQNGLSLLGYDLQAGQGGNSAEKAQPGSAVELQPGQPLHVSLFWAARGPVQGAYTIFVHLTNANGVVLAQSDQPPWQGMFPTDRWTVGETVQDDYTLQVPPQLNSGTYTLRVGLYIKADQPVPTLTGDTAVSLESPLHFSPR